MNGQEVLRRRLHDSVQRPIKPDETEVNQGILRMYAAGFGYPVIAKTPNNVTAYAAQNAELFGGRFVPPKGRAGCCAPTAIPQMIRH